MPIPKSAKVPFHDRAGNPIAQLTIHANDTESLVIADALQARNNGEARIQLLEGSSYEYEVDRKGAYLVDEGSIVTRSRVNKGSGTLATGLMVGTGILAQESAPGGPSL